MKSSGNIKTETFGLDFPAIQRRRQEAGFMRNWGSAGPWLLGFAIAAGECAAAFGVAHLAWVLLYRDVEPGAVAGLCALLVLVWAVVGGVAFGWAVRGR